MKTPVVIVGGGPAGSASAISLLRQGIRPLIVEKEAFPRYHVGESMTGECGAVTRGLGFGEEMMRRGFPLKHGVKVFGHNSWFVPVMARTADGHLEDQITWQVRRNEFDKMLLDGAIANGADYLPGQALNPLVADDGSVRGVRVRTSEGSTLDVDSAFLLDCSGQQTFLANSGVTGPKYVGAYDKQIAVFSQVAGGLFDDGGEARDSKPGNTLIFYRTKYQWAWWIPLNDEVVSVGVVVPAAYFQAQRLNKADFLKKELHDIHPALKRRLPVVNLVEEARSIANYSFQVRKFAGKGYICVGDAHRFLDPIFSFGLFVSMKEGTLAASAAKAYLDGVGRDLDDPFVSYRLHCEKALDMLEDTVDSFWEHPLAFARLAHVDHQAELIDLFANRVHDVEPSSAILRMRRLLKRERTYEEGGLYSVPIGSRYHPERAPLWEGRAIVSGEAQEPPNAVLTAADRR